MPNYNANPTGADLQDLLSAASLWDEAYAGLADGYVVAAVEEFENLTGRRPFLAAGSQTLFFDPPGDTSNALQYSWKGGEKRLELDVPFTQITAIYTGCVGQSIEGGTACTVGQNVFLMPGRYDVKGVPIEWLEFTFPVWGGSLSVGVTGTPGSYAVWPADAFQAVVAGAAAKAMRDAMEGMLAGPSEIQLGDQTVTSSFDEELGAGWRARFDEAVRRYRLMRVGL